MLFKFVNKNIVVDCFTMDPLVYEHFQIQRAIKFYPDWFLKLRNHFDAIDRSGLHLQFPTMKRCYGFVELYKQSFILPAWTDIKISVNPQNLNFNLDITNQTKSIHSHMKEQYAELFKDTKFMHFKIETPWLLQEKKGVNFYYNSCSYNNTKAFDYFQFPGLLEFKYNSDLSLQLAVNLENKFDQIDLTFLAGEPISMLTPLTEKAVKFKHHLIEESEFKKIWKKNYRTVFGCFNDSPMMHKRIKDLESKKSTCPFKF